MIEYKFCERCGRILADGLEEWDDTMDLLCFGEADPSCYESNKFKKIEEPNDE
jgi:hypothetical protein